MIRGFKSTFKVTNIKVLFYALNHKKFNVRMVLDYCKDSTTVVKNKIRLMVHDYVYM